MGALYIDKKDSHVKMDGDAIAFYYSGKRDGLVPLKPLDRVYIVGNITLEAGVLHKLCEQNTQVIFLSGKQLRFRGVLAPSLHKNGRLRLCQYRQMGGGFPIQFSNEIILRKLAAQGKFLDDLSGARPEHRHLLAPGASAIHCAETRLKEAPAEIESLRGIEGAAANAYFGAVTAVFPPSLKFSGRHRRPPPDPVNAMLSLSYTLLHWEMVREIQCIGLDPYLGFYHQFVYGRESLACDLIEPFRVEADRWVYEMFRMRTLTADHFTQGDERPGCYLTKAGRRHFYEHFEAFRKQFGGSFRDEAQGLARRILSLAGEDLNEEEGNEDAIFE